MKNFITLIAAGAVALSAAGAAPYTAKDYTSISRTAPASVKEMQPMADGESYSAISDDGRSIDTYSYRDGRKTGTLFSIDGIKGDVKISEFSGYRVSENGRKILLWNDKEQVWRYSFFAEYYVYDIMRSTLKRVSAKGKQRAATLSHDGNKVAYQRGNNIFISNLEYDTDNQITKDGKVNEIIYGTPDWAYEEEFGVLNTMRWSKDDNTLAFIRFDESQVPVYSFDDYRSFCDSDPLGDPYPEAYEYKYPLAGYPNSRVSVLAYDLNNRVTKTMDLPIGENDYVPSMEFGGDGVSLMVMLLNRDQNKLNLYKVNPASTVGRMIYSDESAAWLAPAAYQQVRYGASSFVICSERSGWRHLYEYDYSGNQLRQITKGDFNVTDYYGSDPRTGTAFVQTTSLGAINRNVAKVEKGGKLTLLHPEEGWESSSFSGNFQYYVRTYSSASTPPQYTLWSLGGKRIAELEMNKAYAERYAGIPRKEFIKVKNDAGEDMDAYIIRPNPEQYSGNLPLLMYQYNGPDSQQVVNKWALDGTYYFADQGYIVGCVDGRGTGNRSREWAHCVYRRLGHFETLDQIAGARNMSALPGVDPDRVGCFGWSYGGYMTLMELTQPGNPFKCGVAMAPVTDWRWYDSIYTERYMSTPQQNEAGYEAASAINRTDDLKARLLILSGTSDDNVHFYNTLKYTSKLNYQGTIFDMMALTGFEHSLRMCNARTMLYRKIVDFLDIYLK